MTDCVIYDFPLNPRKYLEDSIKGFINDPPDNEFQKGYLCALLAVYGEALRTSNELSSEAHLILSKLKRSEK